MEKSERLSWFLKLFNNKYMFLNTNRDILQVTFNHGDEDIW